MPADGFLTLLINAGPATMCCAMSPKIMRDIAVGMLVAAEESEVIALANKFEEKGDL
jgi:hypothetical protein